jgi:hypothetical protein
MGGAVPARAGEEAGVLKREQLEAFGTVARGVYDGSAYATDGVALVRVLLDEGETWEPPPPTEYDETKRPPLATVSSLLSDSRKASSVLGACDVSALPGMAAHVCDGKRTCRECGGDGKCSECGEGECRRC